jgi:ABC-type transport system substrate-binding protein/streptogramin lyase
VARGRLPDIGTDVGPYRIDALLGRGAMGVVYRATDRRLGRPVALKLLATELASDDDFRERFLQESRLAASIDHAGIVPIYDADEVDGLLYIAMRFVDGSDLAALLREAGRLAPERALDLVGQLAEALDAAHARGLVHRDVKPSNVLLAREGTREHVYLADFGLTKTAGDQTRTRPDQVVGTVLYMAPEVLRGGKPGAASDRYALACVLYKCLVGEVPFSGPNDAAVIYGHLETEPPRASRAVAELPEALDRVLARGLAKDPDARFASGADLVAAAAAALHGEDAHRPRRRRRALVAGGLASAAAAAALILALASGGDGRAFASTKANAVAVIDVGHRSLTAQVELDGAPSQLAGGAGAVWVTDEEAGTVSRIDPATHTVRQTIRVGSGASALAVEPDGVWVANGRDGTVSLVSPRSDQLVETVRIGTSAGGICVTDGFVWVASPSDHSIVRLDRRSGRKAGSVDIDDVPGRLACGGGSVWASSESGGSVTQVDTESASVVHKIEVGGGASGIALGAGALWVANTDDGTVSRIDPSRAVVTATVPISTTAGPSEVAVLGKAVWIGDRYDGTLARIGPGRAVLVEKLRLGVRPVALAPVDGSLWVGTGAIGPAHRGGELRVVAPALPLRRDLDPAVSYDTVPWGLLDLTNDGLTAFRRVGGQSGATLVPDLAVSLPVPAAAGRTYTFQIRAGVRFSDGSPVRPSSIRHGLVRSISSGGPAVQLLAAINGAAGCPGMDCDPGKGIVADDRAGTVVLHLTRTDPDLLYKLALPFAVAVPETVPDTVSTTQPVPATGPYMLTGYASDGVLRLVRNPRFEPWSVAAAPDGYPDTITMRAEVNSARGLRTVASGQADFVSPTQPELRADQLTRLENRYAGQLHRGPQPSTLYEWLNTRVPPFDRRDARRALSLAIDRGAIVAAEGGPHLASPTCQLVPPTVPGYAPSCRYPHDPAAARRLVRRSGTRGMRVTVWGFKPYFTRTTRLIVRTLRSIGYRAHARLLDGKHYFSYVGDSRHHAQVGVTLWVADYASASNFLAPQFSCASFSPHTANNTNPSQFCDPAADRLMARAANRQTSSPQEAARLWVATERRLAASVPAVPLYNPAHLDFVSRRVGNYQYNPQWGPLLDQLWVR